MIDELIRKTNDSYNISFNKYSPLTSKSYILNCDNNKCYFTKKTELFVDEKYKFLYNQGIDNILYPVINKRGNFVTEVDNKLFYVTDFYQSNAVMNETKAFHMSNQLRSVHNNTYFKRQLSVKDSRKKMEDIFEYLQYKFSTLEAFVRSVESRPFDEYSIMILKNYQYILDGKKVMANLQRKIIADIKEKKSVNFSFIHNNPKLNHLLIANGKEYLISIEKSKIGISSLDMAKFYIETEDVKIDMKSLIITYFSQYEDDFYFDYFCFLVLLYYIKGIVIIDKDYVSSQSIIYASQSIKKFINMFDLLQKN